jgi:hypothetical protein
VTEEEFYKQRNVLLQEHARAVDAFGEATADTVSLGLRVKTLQEEVARAEAALGGACQRRDIHRGEVEHAMGALLSHQDKFQLHVRQPLSAAEAQRHLEAGLAAAAALRDQDQPFAAGA